MIHPKPGHVVIYTPHTPPGEAPNPPHGAIITHVHHDRAVDVEAFPHGSASRPHNNVPLMHAEDVAPDWGHYVQYTETEQEMSRLSADVFSDPTVS
jgi:hypothetical protein